MAYDYDKLYASTPDALGPPFKEFEAFFDAITRPLRVLDLGCGQGRDALFIARLGHQVLAVDMSPHGIRDIEKVASAEGLSITGIVADICDFCPDGFFDIVLIDRTLHMLGAQDRRHVMNKVMAHVAGGGWLLIADERKNLPGLRRQIVTDERSWTVTKEAKGFLFAQVA